METRIIVTHPDGKRGVIIFTNISGVQERVAEEIGKGNKCEVIETENKCPCGVKIPMGRTLCPGCANI